MFYDEAQAIKACEEVPSLVFELIKEEHFQVVDYLLTKKKIDINICDELGNNILVKLLKKGQYDLVLKHMKNKKWDVNHQNNDGDTFAHILVVYNYVNVLEIIRELKKNKNFMPNIKNNRGETILDKSINDNYIYTTVKILEDRRFNNIDVISFRNLYNTYVKNNNYGKYSKLTNLQIILDNLEDKPLLPNMKKLYNTLKANFDVIKEEVINNKTNEIDTIISSVMVESRV